MTQYVAIVATPGCLPDTDTPPPTFDNARDAWTYLAEERAGALLDAEDYDGEPLDVDSLPTRGASGGSTWLPTPGRGRMDRGDLGLIYSVEWVEPSDDEDLFHSDADCL